MKIDIDHLKNNSLMNLELSADTKTQVTNAEITKFIQEVKKVLAKKDVVIVVLEA